MRKFRKTMFVITILFAVITFLGLASLIFSTKDFSDSLFDCIVLFISATSIAIAIFSQLSADKESRRIEKIVREIGEINKITEEDFKQDESLRRKLDKILYLEEEIYRRTGGRKDVKQVEKGSSKK